MVVRFRGLQIRIRMASATKHVEPRPIAKAARARTARTAPRFILSGHASSVAGRIYAQQITLDAAAAVASHQVQRHRASLDRQ